MLCFPKNNNIYDNNLKCNTAVLVCMLMAKSYLLFLFYIIHNHLGNIAEAAS